jgi:hypothetical protein
MATATASTEYAALWSEQSRVREVLTLKLNCQASEVASAVALYSLDAAAAIMPSLSMLLSYGQTPRESAVRFPASRRACRAGRPPMGRARGQYGR